MCFVEKCFERRFRQGITTALLLLLVALTPGCGGGQTEIPQSGPVTQEQFASLLPEVVCDRVDDCDCENGNRRSYCEAAVEDYLSEILHRWDDERTEFDGDVAWQCLDAADQAKCDHAAWLPFCERVNRPLIELGSPCSYGYECVGYWEREAYCNELGICADRAERRGKEGDACSFTVYPNESYRGERDPTADVDCHLNDGLICRNGGCVAVSEEGGPCEYFDDCALGNHCLGDGQTGTCVPNRKLGESCPPYLQACGLENYCSEDGICTRLREVGESCGPRSECAGSNCTEFGVCAEAGHETVCDHFSFIELED